MGIHNLNKFIKAYAPAAQTTLPLTAFQGTRVAIDANNLLCSTMYAANVNTYDHQELKLNPHAMIDRTEADREWYRQLLSTVLTYTSYGITPVFVFDGKHCPGKAEVRDKRRIDRENTQRRTAELTAAIAEKPLLERTDEEIEKLGKAKSSVETKVSVDQINTSKALLRAVGVPVLTALGDGEDLCVALSHEQYVSAVVSRDTDCYALGCAITISGFSKGSRAPNHTVDVTLYEKILDGLKLDRPTFVDLCITGKCDYNRGVPKVGLIRAYDMIVKNGGLEAMIEANKNKYDFYGEEGMNLNLEFCRKQIFAVKRAKDCLDEEHAGVIPSLDLSKGNIATHQIKSYLRSHGVEDFVVRLSTSYRNVNHSGDYGAEYVLGKRIIPDNARPSMFEICLKPDPQKAEILRNGRLSEGNAVAACKTVDVIRDMIVQHFD